MPNVTQHPNHSAKFASNLLPSKVLTIAFAGLLAVAITASAQTTYSAAGPGGAIPDGSGNNVPGVPLVSTATITNSGIINFVTVDFSGLSHTYVGDLTMVLTHPNGFTSIDLMLRPGRGLGTNDTFGYSSDFVATNTYSFSDAGASLFGVSPPAAIASGIYIPSSNNNAPGLAATNLSLYVYTPTSFASTFGGLDSAGIWTLTITDWAGVDTGSVEGWTVNVTVPEPSTYALLLTAGLGAVCFIRRRK